MFLQSQSVWLGAVFQYFMVWQHQGPDAMLGFLHSFISWRREDDFLWQQSSGIMFSPQCNNWHDVCSFRYSVGLGAVYIAAYHDKTGLASYPLHIQTSPFVTLTLKWFALCSAHWNKTVQTRIDTAGCWVASVRVLWPTTCWRWRSSTRCASRNTWRTVHFHSFPTQL